MLDKYISCILEFIPNAVYGTISLDDQRLSGITNLLDKEEIKELNKYRGGSFLVFGIPIDDEALWFWNHVNKKRYLTANHILESTIVELGNHFPDSRIRSIDRISNNKVAQVELAELAGIGTRGWNNLLLHPEYGAYLQLVTIATLDRYSETEYSTPLLENICIKCGNCIDACPVNAISETGFIAYRCSSVVASPEKVKSKAVAVTANSYIECRACIDSCPIGLNIEKLNEWKK